jgi:hypothetical protein
MNSQEFQEWFDREHPSGNVDWKKEFERLFSVIKQAMPIQCESKAAMGILEIAIETGDRLLNLEQK